MKQLTLYCTALALLLAEPSRSLAQTTPGNTIRPIDEETEGECVELTYDGCSEFGYQNAFFPNFRLHADIAEAGGEFSDFDLLLTSGCHADVRQFFCGFYFPLCFEKGGQACFLKPCRSLCLAVRESCEQLLVTNGFVWPVFLDCDLNGTFSPELPCFGPPEPTPAVTVLPTVQPTSITSPVTTSTTLTPSPSPSPPPPPVCEPIATNYCTEIGYNSTSFEQRNLAQHSTQDDAIASLKNFNLFISSKCSEAIVHFLCLYYVPECGERKVLEPCSELCSFVESDCRGTFEASGIPWDMFFNCRRLPSRFSQSECSGPLDPASVSIPLIPGVTDVVRPTAGANSVSPLSLCVVVLLAVLLVGAL